MFAIKALSIAVLIYGCSALNANNRNPKFRVIAFFTGKQDQAHNNIDTFSLSGRLGLVPQHLSRVRLIRQQHVETYVGDSTSRRPQASGDSPSA